MPLAEDWLLVPPLTGHEPSLGAWAWAQNNEHRLPLPRLMLLALLTLSGGDFRAGMVFNALTAGALAMAMILVARLVRGGATSYADAFFPLALLHIGNWDNLVWGWQLQFVLSTTLICFVLLVAAGQRLPLAPPAAIAAGVCVVLLPLCGASGLAFAPPLSLWLACLAVLRWRSAAAPSTRWTGVFLLGASSASVLLVGVYFLGYERPWWNPPSPSHTATLVTSAKFLALGFGPAATRAWTLATLATAAFLLTSAALLALGAWRTRGAERLRALGLLLFASGQLVLALGIGWGRAGQVASAVLPTRYVLIALPALCWAYFIWGLYGPRVLARWVQLALFAVMGLLAPLNTAAGFQWRDWYVQGMNEVQQDLDAGLPRAALAERHRAFLLHWDEAKLAAGMEMLRQAGIGPFREMRDDATLRPVDSMTVTPGA